MFNCYTGRVQKNGPPCDKSVKYAGLCELSSIFLGKKQNKQAKQTFFELVNVVLYQKGSLGIMLLPMFHKFQLENSNFKKFSKKYLEIAKILPFSLKLLVIIGHTSQ